MTTYYTLFIYDLDLKQWDNEFGAYTKKECLEELHDSFYYTKAKHAKIIKNDGSLNAIRKIYNDLEKVSV